MKKFLLVALSAFITIYSFSADKYWSGYGGSDNISDGNNWWGNSNPSSGDNLYFDNTQGSRHWVYINYLANSYFGIVMTKNGAGGIKLYGDNTYAYKFENFSDGNLFELSPSSASVGSREIGNRINNDLEINPVGSGGILVSCDKISIDNLNGTRSLKVYGSNTLTINGIIYEKNGTGSTFQLLQSATVELKGNSTFTGLTTISGGTLKLNASGGALNSGNAVTISGGTLEIAQNQTIGNLTMSSGTLKVNAGQTLTITGTYNVTGGTINNQGTIVLQGATAQAFPGTSTTINNGTVNQMNNLTINNAVGVSVDKSFTAATVVVNPGSKININSAITLTATNFTLQSNAGGITATLLNNGTLTATTTNVEQYLGSARNWYISSPLSAVNSPATNVARYYEYIEPGNNADMSVAGSTAYWKGYNTGHAMSVGKGYIAQVTGATTFTFTTNSGSLNNGDVTTPTLTRTNTANKPGFNLIGNPYPSYLDINSFATSPLIEATYWIRSNNSGYVFDTYNIPSALSTGLSGKKVSRYLPPMQAFWVKLKSNQTSGTLTFTNAMRAHADDTGNSFRAPALSTNKIVRLEVKSNNNVDEALIYFNENAANNLDAYDSQKWFNNVDSVPEIYTVADEENLAINGFNSIQLNSEIPLGFRTGLTDLQHNYKLKASQLQNVENDVELVLIDKDSAGETILNEGSEYTFTSAATNSTNRFSLVFRAKGTTTGNCCYSATNNIFKVNINKNNQITVSYNGELDKNAYISVLNSIGQQVLHQSVLHSATTLAPSFKCGVYIVNLISQGKTYRVKVTI